MISLGMPRTGRPKAELVITGEVSGSVPCRSTHETSARNHRSRGLVRSVATSRCASRFWYLYNRITASLTVSCGAGPRLDNRALRWIAKRYASSASKSLRVIAVAAPASDSAASASLRLRACNSRMRSSTVSRATIR